MPQVVEQRGGLHDDHRMLVLYYIPVVLMPEQLAADYGLNTPGCI
jgi:hypothetical protein